MSSSSSPAPEDPQVTQASKRKADLEEIEVDVSAPEPPSKRAKRALKKGKSLPAKATSDDEKDNDGEGGKSKSEKARSEHAVWIGNLPFNVTPQELRQWLIDNSGGVLTDESITRIKLPMVKTPGGRAKDEKPVNKGFAYVDFTDIGGKVAAIALSETQLAYRKLLIKDATSFEGRPKKEKEATEGDEKANGQKQPGAQDAAAKDSKASRKIFVGNLSFQVKEDDVWKNFEKCGEIESVKLATFEDSGKCKGYGWVRFKDAEAAAWAVKGFVKVKEDIETEADFEDDNDSSSKNNQQQKQTKTRKWWINRMFGRELKLELAEDDQARYKKRFGKDRGAAKNGPPRGGPRGNFRRDQNGGENEGGAREELSRPPERAQAKTAKDLEIARLTGKVVESTGTKMTFD